VGAFWSEPTHDDNRASDAPVAILLDTGACLSRCTESDSVRLAKTASTPPP